LIRIDRRPATDTKGRKRPAVLAVKVPADLDLDLDRNACGLRKE
jgi:hypothetical protein